MFLHLGGSSTIPAEDVIMIIDLKSARHSKITMELIALLEAEGMIEEASPGVYKSLTITDDKAYLSPISSVTLKNRLHFWLGSEKKG
ncbi:MAG TPA: DUF370 domain-containing protein [Firmicutes bacterium]|jgi:hypothetical protein|nr:DUF370 domain-containing protein [Bacillota bacterium]